MRYALLRLTAVCGLGTFSVFQDPSMAVIAVLLPDAFLQDNYLKSAETRIR